MRALVVLGVDHPVLVDVGQVVHQVVLVAMDHVQGDVVHLLVVDVVDAHHHVAQLVHQDVLDALVVVLDIVWADVPLLVADVHQDALDVHQDALDVHQDVLQHVSQHVQHHVLELVRVSQPL